MCWVTLILKTARLSFYVLNTLLFYTDLELTLAVYKEHEIYLFQVSNEVMSGNKVMTSSVQIWQCQAVDLQREVMFERRRSLNAQQNFYLDVHVQFVSTTIRPGEADVLCFLFIVTNIVRFYVENFL